MCLAACVHVWGKKESTRKKASEKRKFSKKLRAQGYFNYLTGLDGILLIKKRKLKVGDNLSMCYQQKFFM